MYKQTATAKRRKFGFSIHISKSKEGLYTRPPLWIYTAKIPASFERPEIERQMTRVVAPEAKQTTLELGKWRLRTEILMKV
jgi:hypothetical protein